MQRAGATQAMTAPLAGTPDVNLSTPYPAGAETAKLENGMTLVALNTPQTLASMSLFVRAGPRYEHSSDAGSAHFLKRYAFKSTEKKYFLQLVRDVDVRGSEFHSAVSRENVSYHVSGMNVFTDNMAETLGAVAEPLIEEYVVDRLRSEVSHELAAAHADTQLVLLDTLHREAFRDQQLANSIVCPSYQVDRITDHNLRKHTSTYYTPDRMTVVATGTDLATLKGLVEKNFKPTDLRAMVREYLGAGVEDDIVGPLKAAHQPLVAVPAKFVGGSEVRLPNAGNAHLALGFQGVGYNSGVKEVAAAAVLQNILGGFSSKSSPYGRGLTPGSVRNSRLGQNVVAANADWVHQAAAVHLPYVDGGLFAVYGEAERGKAAALVESLMKQIQSLDKVSDEEVLRGKAQAKGALAQAVDGNREALAEFFATQVQSGSAPLTPAQFFKQIDAVTTSDVQAAARRLLSSKPVVVASGDVSGLPRL
jgi:predicted Zn-dependent peptidase